MVEVVLSFNLVHVDAVFRAGLNKRTAPNLSQGLKRQKERDYCIISSFLFYSFIHSFTIVATKYDTGHETLKCIDNVLISSDQTLH